MNTLIHKYDQKTNIIFTYRQYNYTLQSTTCDAHNYGQTGVVHDVVDDPVVKGLPPLPN